MLLRVAANRKIDASMLRAEGDAGSHVCANTAIYAQKVKHVGYAKTPEKIMYKTHVSDVHVPYNA